MFKFQNKNKSVQGQLQAGMSYAELIVVLAIFSVLASVAMFNYGLFQAKVDIKNLANDIALKISEAQKASSFGRLPSVAHQAQAIAGWNPSYGLYMDLAVDNNTFFYFTDLNNDKLYQGSDCAGECVQRIDITKNNTISEIKVFLIGGSSSTPTKMHLTFTRPGLSPSVITGSGTTPVANLDYVQITTVSPRQPSAKIKVYASGRIQID